MFCRPKGAASLPYIFHLLGVFKGRASVQSALERCYPYSPVSSPRRWERTVQGTDPENAAEIRERVRKMSDEELLRYGAICKSICSTETNLNKSSLDAWTIQLQEARA